MHYEYLMHCQWLRAWLIVQISRGPLVSGLVMEIFASLYNRSISSNCIPVTTPYYPLFDSVIHAYHLRLPSTVFSPFSYTPWGERPQPVALSVLLQDCWADIVQYHSFEDLLSLATTCKDLRASTEHFSLSADFLEIRGNSSPATALASSSDHPRQTRSGIFDTALEPTLLQKQVDHTPARHRLEGRSA